MEYQWEIERSIVATHKMFVSLLLIPIDLICLFIVIMALVNAEWILLIMSTVFLIIITTGMITLYSHYRNNCIQGNSFDGKH